MDLSALHPFWAFGLPIAASLPLGAWMARALDPPQDRVGRGVDALPMSLRRMIGRGEPARMDGRRYAFALLTFNAALFALSFLVLLVQHRASLLNPDGKGTLAGLGYKYAAGVDHPGADTALIFNTVCSFVTNTNLQHYSGEQHLSYFGQMGGIVWLQLITPAIGLAALVAVARGLRGDRDLGDFYLDTIRGLVLVLIPLSVGLALLLVATGVPMTFAGAARATTLEGAEQTIARGPVAALVSIKQLGSNGGGFFGPNSTHPLENPNPWSNLLEVSAILLVPMACLWTFGLMLRQRAHAAVIFGVMLAMAVAGACAAIWAELGPNAALEGLPVAVGPNMEGKEVRIGPVASGTWAAITAAVSSGSVNAMHDSLNPLGGLVPMALMMANTDFSGVGAGLLNMLVYIIVAVFLAGLMVGRTPEYLGKKVEAREVKLAMIALLIHPLVICGVTGLFAASDWGAKTVANPGPHGFSEILYEVTSSAANNGSGFEGLSDNNPPWNIGMGLVLLLGRYPALVLPILIAASLARKARVPESTGTLRTDSATFGAMLLGTVLLVGALSFMPAVVLGPVADHLAAVGPRARSAAPATAPAQQAMPATPDPR